jgi:hypothetical protein
MIRRKTRLIECKNTRETGRLFEKVQPLPAAQGAEKGPDARRASPEE